jgi:hypothetical protein
VTYHTLVGDNGNFYEGLLDWTAQGCDPGLDRPLTAEQLGTPPITPQSLQDAGIPTFNCPLSSHLYSMHLLDSDPPWLRLRLCAGSMVARWVEQHEMHGANAGDGPRRRGLAHAMPYYIP